MTRQASRLISTVDEMLLEAGQEQDTELRAALLSLGALASLPAPPPNARLAALLDSRPGSLSWRRRLRRHRPAIVGLAVVAGMGLGVTGVAASASRPAEQASASVQHLLEDWAPSWNVSGPPVPATGPLPQPAPGEQEPAADSGTAGGGQQESPARDPAKLPPKWPGHSPAGPAGAGSHDAGPSAGAAAGAAAADTEAAGTESAGTEFAGTEAKVPSEGGTVPESSHVAAKAQETARQALENAEKVPAGVVPESAVTRETGNGSAGKPALAKKGAVKKADPGAAWLKKFKH